MHDAQDTYSTAFIILIGVALTGALIVSFLPKTGNRTE